MNVLFGLWEAFWFRPAAPTNLALSRIAFFAGVLVLCLPRDFSSWALVSPVFFQPLFVQRVLALSVAPAPVLAALGVAWKASLALACVGYRTRAATIVAFALGIYLLGVPHSFSKLHHQDALVVLTLGVMAFARPADAYSVDAWLARRRGAGGSARPSGEYTWPLRLVQVLLVLLFFAAGISKLRHAGIEWAVSDNLGSVLIGTFYHRSSEEPLTTWGLHLAQHPRLVRAAAASVLLVELAAPLALFATAARRVLVPALLLMIVAIRGALGPSFLLLLPCFTFWVAWDRIGLRQSDHGRTTP